MQSAPKQALNAHFFETGSHTTNPRGGAPYGLELYDFPVAEECHFLLLRGIGLFTSNVYKAVLKLGVPTVEQVLLYHVVPGARITAARALVRTRRY